MAATDVQERETREQYLAWKRLVPYIYDSFINHHLTWPSLSCRWGPVVDETATRRKQRLYLSDQTVGTEPNKLVWVTAELAKPRLSTSEAVSTWSEQARSPHISNPLKTLVHPGEVNKLLDIPKHPSVVVTHSDTPDVYVWNFDAQPDRGAALAARAFDSKEPSIADVILKGHTANAEFALGTCSIEPLVASGGKDNKVLIWNLNDISTALTSISSPGKSPEIQPRSIQNGHLNTVEDVAFMPGSKDELMSVGDDYNILFWDLRVGSAPVERVPRAHGERDVHCCDWNPYRLNLVVSGAQDGGVRVWDRRNLGGPLLSLNHHSDAVMNVEWSPHQDSLFATGADDGLVCIWDLEAKIKEGAPDGPAAAKRAKVAAPPQLLFQHAGHQSPVVDFCWNPQEPWMLLSASVDTASSGGGTLQLWRISDLIYRPEEEIMAELEQYKDFIATGAEKKGDGEESEGDEEDRDHKNEHGNQQKQDKEPMDEDNKDP